MIDDDGDDGDDDACCGEDRIQNTETPVSFELLNEGRKRGRGAERCCENLQDSESLAKPECSRAALDRKETTWAKSGGLR